MIQLVEVNVEAWAMVDDCHNNVTQMISKMGGEQVVCILVIAEKLRLHFIRHSVWKSGTGELIDITPVPEIKDKFRLIIHDFLPHRGVTLTHQNVLIYK